MLKALKYPITTVLLLLTFQGYSQKIDFVDISSINKFQHLANEALILEDKDNQFIFKDILFDQGTNSRYFQKEVDIPYMDFTSSTYWMKLKVKNDTTVERKYYIELARPLTNLVNLYVFDENNELVKIYYGGDDLPFTERPYLHRNFVIPINFPPNSKRTLIVKTKSDGEILKLPIKIWDIDTFTQFASTENFFLGLYYGFILLVFILFSFFGYSLQQRLYVFFVSYVFVLGLFQFSLDGFAYQFFWPNNPWLGNHAILIFAAISIFALLAYADKFFGFYKGNKKFYRIYKFFYGTTVIGLITSFMSGEAYALTFPILNVLSFIFICSFFVGIYLNYKAGLKPGIEVTLAFIFLWLGAIFFVLSNVNIIENEFLATNALKVGSAIEITFLSLAMAGRYRKTQMEKIVAQKDAFNRLEEINILKNEQTEKLEKQVQERTQEISTKNDILSSQNKEIINSITYAKRLQDAILPSRKLLEALFKEFNILFLPKDIVSGDFYWVEHTKTHSFFAVADCTGHGVPGAMVSVVGYNALNRCINEMKLTDPGKILDKLKDLIVHTFSSEEKAVSDGMDISLCVWDNKNTLTYAGAFNPLYLIRNEEFIEIKGDKQPVGKFIKTHPFTTHTINLEKGDSVYLFSDGYPDQFGGERGKKLKYSVFKEYLLEVNKRPTHEVNSFLTNKFNEWRGSEEQVDDVCIMNVRF